jgi:hypothetical protein
MVSGVMTVPLASGKGGLGLIDTRQDFGAAALALFPQHHSLRRGALGARNPSGVNGLADKGFLVGVGRISMGVAQENLRVSQGFCNGDETPAPAYAAAKPHPVQIAG